jgi:hypothetical protein
MHLDTPEIATRLLLHRTTHVTGQRASAACRIDPRFDVRADPSATQRIGYRRSAPNDRRSSGQIADQPLSETVGLGLRSIIDATDSQGRGAWFVTVGVAMIGG